MTDLNPLVSVIVPTYNRSQYVCEAVHSVLGQTFGNLEVLVVDDRSTDDTAGQLAAIRDPRLTVIVDGHWGWPAKVRNVGIRSARGRFLGFLDSDDLWLPRKLERQLDALQATGLGWVHAGVRTIGANGEPHPTLGTYRPRANGWIVRDLILRRAAINCSTVLMRRELLDRAGTFDETLVSGEDTDLWFRLALRSPVCAVDDVLALWRHHGRHYRAGPGWRYTYLRTMWRNRRAIPKRLRTLWLREMLRVGAAYMTRRALGLTGLTTLARGGSRRAR